MLLYIYTIICTIIYCYCYHHFKTNIKVAFKLFNSHRIKYDK